MKNRIFVEASTVSFGHLMGLTDMVLTRPTFADIPECGRHVACERESKLIPMMPCLSLFGFRRTRRPYNCHSSLSPRDRARVRSSCYGRNSRPHPRSQWRLSLQEGGRLHSRTRYSAPRHGPRRKRRER